MQTAAFAHGDSKGAGNQTSRATSDVQNQERESHASGPAEYILNDSVTGIIGFFCFKSLPDASHHFHMEALERDRRKERADPGSSRPVQMQEPTHHPVDRLLPESNLQRMKRLLERKGGAKAKAPRAGA